MRTQPQTQKQRRTYQQLECIEPIKARQIWQLNIRAGLRYLQQAWTNWFSTELSIQETTDATGKVYWRAYDPVRDRALQFDNEQALLIWLEERHTHRSSSFFSF